MIDKLSRAAPFALVAALSAAAATAIVRIEAGTTQVLAGATPAASDAPAAPRRAAAKRSAS